MSVFSFPGADARAVIAAVSRSQAIIEFDPAGKILFANETSAQRWATGWRS